MKQEAEANADADKKEKERVEKLNTADSLIFQTEKQLKEYGDKLSEGNKKPIEEALAHLKEVHQKQDLDAIDPAVEALNKAWEGAAQEMYAASQGDAAGAQPGADANAGDTSGSDNGSGDVSDVEYEEVK